MNQEISSLSSVNKLSSKPRASMQKTTTLEPSKEVGIAKEVNDFGVKMDEINRAFSLVNEIRHSLETALKNLQP